MIKFLSRYLFIPLKWIYHINSHMLYIVCKMTNCQCELLFFFLAASARVTISLVQLAKDNDSRAEWNELQS